jgi:type IV secretory pathway VirB6-like protein
VIAIHQQRIGFLVALAFVAAVTVYAAVTAGIVEATAFAPVFLGMVLLEQRKRSK